jgi:hypothetical protein
VIFAKTKFFSLSSSLSVRISYSLGARIDFKALAYSPDREGQGEKKMKTCNTAAVL